MGQRLEHTSVPTSHLNSKRQRLNSEHQTPKQVAGRCGLNFLDGIREGDAGDCIEAGAVRSALYIDGYIDRLLLGQGIYTTKLTTRSVAVVNNLCSDFGWPEAVLLVMDRSGIACEFARRHPRGRCRRLYRGGRGALSPLDRWIY